MGNIIKRDGTSVPFDATKISDAINKALASQNITDPQLADQIADIISQDVQHLSNLTIDDIQHRVENRLMVSNYPNVARAYIEYRHERDQIRQNAPTIEESISKLIEKDKSVVNENANKDANVFNTQRDLTAGSVAKSYALNHMLPPHIANAHLNGDIHFHDLDYSPFTPYTNCCLVDTQNMLKNGFQIGNAKVESPKSINTAAAQIAQIIANVASSQYGGTSIDRIDEVLAPYAELNYQKHLKDARDWVEESKQEAYAHTKTVKDIYDAMQSLEYEVNTLYTSNGQTPFVTFGFGIGTQKWAKEIQKAILQVRIDGLGKDKHTAIFPKLVFGLKRGTNLNPEDPHYDVKQLALECSAKRMYPDVVSYDKLVDIEGDYKAPMGCRSFLPKWVDPETGEAINSGRLNLGVVTLNLPRIALESKANKQAFWDILNKRLNTAHEALKYRIKRTMEAVPENAPILYQHGAFGTKPEVKDFFLNKRATISLGYIGLYEVATVFYGPNWETNEEAKAFTLDVLQVLYNATKKWREEEDIWYSVYATPSESLTDRFCKLDTEKFGSIPDITDKGYYTNSFHYDVRKNPTPFEKIDFEAPYPHLTTGGFIHYCEYPKLTHNLQALEAVWDYAYDKVAYLGTNTPIDKCYECNFEGEFETTSDGFKCPECGNNNPETTDVVKRTCGYLGNPIKRPMVAGRHKEIASRTKHI